MRTIRVLAATRCLFAMFVDPGLQNLVLESLEDRKLALEYA
jgi:hypothetical protein